jgi:hypothetical protein
MLRVIYTDPRDHGECVLQDCASMLVVNRLLETKLAAERASITVWDSKGEKVPIDGN